MDVHVDKTLAVGDAGIRNHAGAGEELEELKELADADSLFCKVAAAQVHHKICRHDHQADEEATERCHGIRVKTPTVLFHGFRASVFSWEGVMKPLAQMTSSEVLAFDRPAFGMTSRPSPPPASCSERDGGNRSRSSTSLLNPYSTAFSVLITLSFMNLLGVDHDKSILIGHSAGCLVALETYFQAPEKIAALILVAPAILEPFTTLKNKMVIKGNGAEPNSKEEEDNFSDSAARCNFSLLKIHHFDETLRSLLHGMSNFVASLYTGALSAFLKSGLALILPLKAKGWEKGILEYLSALLTESSSKQPLSRRLAQISCPVLIVTGDTDRLVPSWNSERLSKVIHGSIIEVIKGCGHIPHEERKEEFLLVVKRFLERVHPVSNGHSFQTSSSSTA